VSPGPTLESLYRQALARLAAAGCAEPEADARMLLSEAAGEPRLSLALHGDRAAPHDAAARLEAMIARRVAGEPVGRIIGRRAFWTLDVHLSAETLEPRPDSEALIEAALEALGPRRAEPLTILDLGVGSGCLLLSLMSECPASVGVGVDVSEGALRTARANARAAGLSDRCRWIAGDWDAALRLRADIILSNPPYIASGDIAMLARDVRLHDPHRALDGGADGLDAYRRLAGAIPRLLAQDGWAVIELGAGQRDDVTALFSAQGLAAAGCRHDLAGIPRALVLRHRNAMAGQPGT
jgi:release factor glutamine methyltransferase